MKYAWNAERFHTLPHPGSQLDQPVGLLDRMRVASNYYSAIKSYKSREPGKEMAWKKDHPVEWDIAMHVERLRKHAND